MEAAVQQQSVEPLKDEEREHPIADAWRGSMDTDGRDHARGDRRDERHHPDQPDARQTCGVVTATRRRVKHVGQKCRQSDRRRSQHNEQQDEVDKTHCRSTLSKRQAHRTACDEPQHDRRRQHGDQERRLVPNGCPRSTTTSSTNAFYPEDARAPSMAALSAILSSQLTTAPVNPGPRSRTLRCRASG